MMNDDGMYCSAMPFLDKSIHGVNANNNYSLFIIHYSFRQGGFLGN